jgi:hypothetical protein
MAAVGFQVYAALGRCLLCPRFFVKDVEHHLTFVCLDNMLGFPPCSLGRSKLGAKNWDLNVHPEIITLLVHHCFWLLHFFDFSLFNRFDLKCVKTWADDRQR